jgi:hypothetical protein
VAEASEFSGGGAAALSAEGWRLSRTARRCADSTGVVGFGHGAGQNGLRTWDTFMARCDDSATPGSQSGHDAWQLSH